MRKNHWIARLAGLLLVSYTLLVVSVAATGGAGSEGDPLVSLSYLNDTFLAQLLLKVDEKLDVRDQELADKFDAQVRQDTQRLNEQFGGAAAPSSGGTSTAADTFSVVTMSNGQTLYGDIGCEVMLRVGTASCVTPSSPGLIDETDASILGNGSALVKNHLYMMTIDERGVKATAETTKLLVRGGYTIK
ncbi:MAG: hypothetical protein E7474_02515 [Ruminococcaceae bacterium]|nr:hypothetical protein [Oscillospiraceae bacterium]